MTMNEVSGPDAAQTMRGWETNDPGYCLRYVWEAYKAHGAVSSTTYPTAYSAWLATKYRHGDKNPPLGAPVWLGVRSDSNAGDVVISLGNGRVVATDYPTWGVIGECTIDQRLAQTGRPYLGWTDDFLGNWILTGDDDMGLTSEERGWLEVTYNSIKNGKSGVRQDGSVTKVIKHGDQVSTDSLKRLQTIQPLVENMAETLEDLANIPAGEIDYDALARALRAAGVTAVVIEPTTPDR